MRPVFKPEMTRDWQFPVVFLKQKKDQPLPIQAPTSQTRHQCTTKNPLLPMIAQHKKATKSRRNMLAASSLTVSRCNEKNASLAFLMWASSASFPVEPTLDRGTHKKTDCVPRLLSSRTACLSTSTRSVHQQLTNPPNWRHVFPTCLLRRPTSSVSPSPRHLCRWCDVPLFPPFVRDASSLFITPE